MARRQMIPGVGSTGLDDGPYLPGKAPRKAPTPKTPEELKAIRAKAWTTRRADATRIQSEIRAVLEGG